MPTWCCLILPAVMHKCFDGCRTSLHPAASCEQLFAALVAWLWHNTRLDVPDVLGIFTDGAVCAELAAACCHHDGHLVPLGRVLICLLNMGLQADTTWCCSHAQGPTPSGLTLRSLNHLEAQPHQPGTCISILSSRVLLSIRHA